MDNRIKLIEYLPQYVANYKEIKEIMNDEQNEVDDLWTLHNQVLNNNFVSYADEFGIVRYEEMLSILKKPNQSLDDRKFIILLNMNKESPYTIRTVQTMLSSMLGSKKDFKFTVNNADYNATLELDTKHQDKFIDIIKMLRDIIPANLGFISRMFFKSQPSTLYLATHTTMATRITIGPYLPPPVEVETNMQIGAYARIGQTIIIRGEAPTGDVCRLDED